MPTTAPHAELMTTLLRRYQTQGCTASFHRLVEHYSPLVEKTATRLLNGDAEAARDVAQRVFTDFALLASKLHGDSPPGGWLHRHTVFAASHYREAEERRQRRETEYYKRLQASTGEMTHVVKQAAAVHLLIERLPETDRQIVLARFWDKQSLREIGAALGLSEEATQKRLARTLEKLRVRLGVPRPGHTAAIGALLGLGSSSKAAPAIFTSPLATTASPAATGATLLIPMATASQKATVFAAACLLALGAAGGIRHWQKNRELREPQHGPPTAAASHSTEQVPKPPQAASDKEIAARIKEAWDAFSAARRDHFLSTPEFAEDFKAWEIIREEYEKSPCYQEFRFGDSDWARRGRGREAVQLAQLLELAEALGNPEKSVLLARLFPPARSKFHMNLLNNFILKDAGKKVEAPTGLAELVVLIRENQDAIENKITAFLSASPPAYTMEDPLLSVRLPNVKNEDVLSYAQLDLWSSIYAGYFDRNLTPELKDLHAKYQEILKIASERYNKRNPPPKM